MAKSAPVPIIKFDKVEKERIVAKIQLYFREELRQEIGGFDAEFLLDFFSEEIGVLFYNQALADADVHLANKFAELTDAMRELEKPLRFKR